ncbi:MAG: hypothetical protein E6G97_21645 [Alphaproteobacteria bacterium]|nr:MAG: hypothetical protein E6G97_21645 [Alphaproteobacteria bacterium]
MTEVEADILNYGKLVVTEKGPVHPAAGYAITARSKDLKNTSQLLPSTLLENRTLDPTQIEVPARARGALFVRRLFLRDDAANLNSVALMRVRFRPEGGDNAGGRPHLQATVWRVPGDQWQRNAGTVLAHAEDHLRAIPDCADEPSTSRFKRDRELIAADTDKASSVGNLADMITDDAVRSRIARIVGCILASDQDKGHSLFGSDHSSTPREFLHAAGAAFDLVHAAAKGRDLTGRYQPGRLSEFCLAVGLRTAGDGRWIRYLETAETTTAPVLSWQEMLKRLSPTPARDDSRGVSRPIDSTASGGGPVKTVPIEVALGDQAKGAAVEPKPHQQRKQLESQFGGSIARDPGVARAFEDWRNAFRNYRRNPDYPQAQALVNALIDAHPHFSHIGFEDFDRSVDEVSQLEKNTLLLGLSLYGRDSLSKHFSLREMLSFAPVAWLAAKGGGDAGSKFGMAMCLALFQKVCELQILWPDELDCLLEAEAQHLLPLQVLIEGRLADTAKRDGYREVRQLSNAFASAFRDQKSSFPTDVSPPNGGELITARTRLRQREAESEQDLTLRHPWDHPSGPVELHQLARRDEQRQESEAARAYYSRLLTNIDDPF